MKGIDCDRSKYSVSVDVIVAESELFCQFSFMEPNPINVQSSGKLFSFHDISLEICEITIEPLGQFF